MNFKMELNQNSSIRAFHVNNEVYRRISVCYLLLIMLLICLSACSKIEHSRIVIRFKNSQNPNDYSKTLFIYPGAKNILYYHLGGSEQVNYRLEQNYPALPFLSAISTYLNTMGFSALTEDFLIPGAPSSLVRAWSEIINATKSPEVREMRWLNDWQAKDTSIIRCFLTYENPHTILEKTKNLNVTIIYIPPAVAKSSRD